MAIRLEDYLNSLPKDQRERILARADELEREIFLTEIRKLVIFAQSQQTQHTDIRQSLIADVEKHKDIALSRLFNYVINGLGGELEIWVKMNGKRKRLTKKAIQDLEKPADRTKRQDQIDEPENGKIASVNPTKNVSVS